MIKITRTDDPHRRICYSCECIFDALNEENPREYRCPACQARYRIDEANKMHQTGVFPGRDGYLMRAMAARYPKNDTRWGDDNPNIFK